MIAVSGGRFWWALNVTLAVYWSIKLGVVIVAGPGSWALLGYFLALLISVYGALPKERGDEQ